MWGGGTLNPHFPCNNFSFDLKPKAPRLTVLLTIFSHLPLFHVIKKKNRSIDSSEHSGETGTRNANSVHSLSHWWIQPVFFPLPSRPRPISHICVSLATLPGTALDWKWKMSIIPSSPWRLGHARTRLTHRANTPLFALPRSRLDCTCNAAYEDFLDLGGFYIGQRPHAYLNFLGRTVWCAVIISEPHTSWSCTL